MHYLHKLLLLSLFFSAITAMTACGKTGPLYLPKPAPAKAPARAPASPSQDK